MRSLILALVSALFFVGCATTPKAEYQTGDCLKVDAALLAGLPPQAQAMVQLMGLKVVDRGEAYYVIEVSLMNQVQGLNAGKFADVEKETNKATCPAAKAETSSPSDLLEE